MPFSPIHMIKVNLYEQGEESPLTISIIHVYLWYLLLDKKTFPPDSYPTKHNLINLENINNILVFFNLEITAANHADICTYAISHDSKIDQPVS